MPGILFIVATPLGNLEDITLRALRVLGGADAVAAESIAHARALFAHLGLKPPHLISCRESNRRQAAALVCDCLRQGQKVALISDAGSPGLCDPAAAVVRSAHEQGFPVTPVPGPSALAAAWSVAGIDHTPFVMLGFLPVKPGPRQKLLESCLNSPWPFIFYEAPHRLPAALTAISELAPQRRLVLCRELSKLHEQILCATSAGLVELINSDKFLNKGEFTIAVEGNPTPLGKDELDAQQLAGWLKVSQGMNSGQLASFLASQGLGQRKEIYQKIILLKKK
jgi:16S rRNA (cytidine1402-2'-O)-methyltransferase